MLVDRALGDADAMTGEQDRGDLRGGASWQFRAERTRLVQQLRVAAYRAQVRTWLRFETTQPLLAIGTNPTVECAAGVLPLAAIRMLVRPPSELSDDPPAFSG